MVLTRGFGVLLAAIVLCAVCLAPGAASAHAGHRPHADAGVSSAADVTAPLNGAAIAAGAAAVVTAAAYHGAAPSGQRNPNCNCDGCCGLSGMTCCGVAMATDLASLSTARAPDLFLPCGMRALRGLPPEALPKPPRSFA
ncbi:MAG: hypothetical protein ACRECO_06200 [Xanthobacteraceae bacterium]